MIKTVGVEVEAFVFFEKESREGRLSLEPADVYSWLLKNYGSEEIHISSSGVVVKTDAGRHLIEFAFPPLDPAKIEAIPDLLQSTLDNLEMPREWRLVFRGVDPRGLSFDREEWAPKPRYHAMWRALEREVDDRWVDVLTTSRIASTHLHLGLDLDNPKVINVFNYFNQPHELLKYASSWRLAIWNGSWASPYRLPIFSWLNNLKWESLEEMQHYWCSIPRLIRRRADGSWEPDLETRSQPGDPVAEGTIWWFCRPRWSLGTIELRFADSMRPERVPRYVKEVVTIVNQLLGL
jgi:hypothetical protein